MKRLFSILLLSLSMASIMYAGDVQIDKSNCTITKDGKTYPLYGEVKIVESGFADLIVKVVDGGSCDLEVRIIDGGHVSSCGEWKIVESGHADLTIKIVDSGQSDIDVKFITGGHSGLIK